MLRRSGTGIIVRMSPWKDIALTYIAREVSNLIALPALHTLSRAGLGAVLGLVAVFLAVLAGKGVVALFGTVTGTVTILLAVDTSD